MSGIDSFKKKKSKPETVQEDGLQEGDMKEEREDISEFERQREIPATNQQETGLGEDLIELGSTGNSSTYTVQGTSGWGKNTRQRAAKS
jgi:hypothetical protein